MLAEGEVSAKHTAQQVEGGSRGFNQYRCVSQLLATGEPYGFVTVGEQAIMPDFHEAWRQDMHQEAANEFKSRNGHDFPLVVIPVVAPFKCDLIITYVEDAIV
jgi:hypothetical protein